MEHDSALMKHSFHLEKAAAFFGPLCQSLGQGFAGIQGQTQLLPLLRIQFVVGILRRLDVDAVLLHHTLPVIEHREEKGLFQGERQNLSEMPQLFVVLVIFQNRLRYTIFQYPFPVPGGYILQSGQVAVVSQIRQLHPAGNGIFPQPDHIVQIGDVRLPGENNFILIDDLIKEFLSLLFPGYQIIKTATYRVMRDMDLDVAEEDTSDLLRAVKHQLREREHGQVMRLEVEHDIDPWLEDQLIDNLHVTERSLYRVDGPVDLTFLKKLSGMVDGHDDLRYKPFKPYLNPALDMDHNIFQSIRKKDYLVQHPYDNFDTVVNFIHQAALDPEVLAIKMTLYRVSGNSPIIKYLGMAAQRGKQVTVLVEVKARFDEQNNVRWAQRLERMGCHVIYGLVGLKTHCKVALVIRRDEDGLRRYMHLGTGNYNDVTAHFYTDMGLFTCDHELGIDMTNLFNMLSGFARPPYFHQLRVSPDGIREFINKKIDEQIEVAKSGGSALIRMKMNSLSDKQIIARLYDAAANGVKIHLLVRGITCLRNDLPELHDNIEVYSIVGRFLEHSRIYYFKSNGNEEIYLASADMMTRNLNRRVEELYPVKQADTKARAIQIFNIMWKDNTKARILEGDHYERIDRGDAAPFNSQEYFVEEAEKMNKQERKLSFPSCRPSRLCLQGYCLLMRNTPIKSMK